MSRRVKTVPEPIKDYRPVIVTGNDYISLPEIDKYGSVMSVTFLNQAQASLFEVRSIECGDHPFIVPLLEWNGMQVDLRAVRPKVDLKWDWVPEFTWDLPNVSGGPIRLCLRIVAPPDEKGFCYILKLERLGLQSDVSRATRTTSGVNGTAGSDIPATGYSMELNRQEPDGQELNGQEPNRHEESWAMKTLAKIGLICTWGSSMFRVFTSRPISCARSCRYDQWTESVVAEAMGPLPLFGFAINSSEEFDNVNIESSDSLGTDDSLGTEESSGVPCRIKVSHDRQLAPGDTATVAFYVAFNREADGARTTGVHLKRVGWQELEERTYAWLRTRRRSISPQPRCMDKVNNQGELSDPSEMGNCDEVANRDDTPGRLESVVNRNLLFNYFFATGKTLDSESLVAVTSRSPRYYVSAAFWARDVLLWSMPALVLTDTARARDVLLYSTRIGTFNVGDHALYMDGTALYPGFELDEAAAHIVGLGTYLDATADYEILEVPGMVEGIRRTLATIEQWLVRDSSGKPVLCRTFLDPSDDPVEFPFLTYSNVLLWKAWMIAFCIFKKLGGEYAHVADELHRDAKALEEAIRRYCVVDGPFGPMYAWAVDLEPVERNECGNFGSSTCSGELISRINHEVYDNPPGSLELIRHHGFPHDEEASKILRNTQRWIRSQHNPYYFDGEFGGPGSAHSPHPWPMAAANTILAEVAECEATGTCDTEAVKQAVRLLTTASMDGGLVCESIDAVTGVAKTGLALATGAGFVAYALWRGREIGLDSCC